MPAFGRTDEQKKQHRERSQPFNRSRFGLLEKKRDYVLRASDYKQKQQRLKILRSKASQKNEDEFYFGMVKQTTKNGLATKTRGNESLGQDVTKILKTQDAAYIQTVSAIERQKLANLLSNQHSAVSDKSGSHAVFVDSLDEAAQVDPDAQHHRIDVLIERLEELDSTELDETLASQRAKLVREIEARQDRLAKLHVLEKEVALHRNLQTKGSRKLMGKDADGTPKYKWKQERKR